MNTKQIKNGDNLTKYTIALLACVLIPAFTLPVWGAPPSTSLQGAGKSGSLSNSGGVAAGSELVFTFDINKKDRNAVGWHSEARFAANTSGTVVNMTRSNFTKVECLVVDSATNSAWWAGTVVSSTFDTSFSADENRIQQQLIAKGKLIQFGRFIDQPGQAETRSPIATAATVSYVPLNNVGDEGVAFLATPGALAKDICEMRDEGLFRAANFLQLAKDPAHNIATIQWLDPDDQPIVGEIYDVNSKNVRQIMTNPPEVAIYDVAGAKIPLTAGRVTIK